MADQVTDHLLKGEGAGWHARQAGAALAGAVVVLLALRPPFVVDDRNKISATHVAAWSATAAALSFTPMC